MPISDEYFHDWLVSYLQKRLEKDYKEVRVNFKDKQEHEFNGHYPDMILANMGMVVSIVEVETVDSVTPEQADRWKELSGLGAKLVLMVPSHIKPKVMDLVMQKGMAGSVGVWSYEVSLKM